MKQSTIRRLNEKTIACGDCYRWAGKEIVRTGKGTLVHGTVADPFTHKRYPHAWLEVGNKVLDWQTMVAGASKYAGKGWPKKEFYSVWKPKDMTRYDDTEAVRNMVAHRQWGPWT